MGQAIAPMAERLDHKQRMLSGELYLAGDALLVADRAECERLTRAFNEGESIEERRAALSRLFGSVGDDVEIRPPFACDYGYNIEIEDRVFVNFGAVFLDCAPVRIGEGTQVGPNVTLSAADHPREPGLRREGWELAKPVTLGRNLWIGTGVVVCPGVTIGDDTIVGAGSVVVRDIPPGVVAAGVPARVVREL